MTKKDSKQIIAVLNALQYFQSSFSIYPMKWEVIETEPNEIKIELDCYFQHRAALLQLLLDDFSTFHTKIEEQVITIK